MANIITTTAAAPDHTTETTCPRYDVQQMGGTAMSDSAVCATTDLYQVVAAATMIPVYNFFDTGLEYFIKPCVGCGGDIIMKNPRNNELYMHALKPLLLYIMPAISKHNVAI